MWTYVRDDWLAAGTDPPAVVFRYSPDRRGGRPRKHLRDFSCILPADAYAGSGHLYKGGPIREAACWAHARRGYYDIHQANKSPIAAEALDPIAVLYFIEKGILGRVPDERTAARRDLPDRRWMRCVNGRSLPCDQGSEEIGLGQGCQLCAHALDGAYTLSDLVMRCEPLISFSASNAIVRNCISQLGKGACSETAGELPDRG